jgi:hypothetical protein
MVTMGLRTELAPLLSLLVLTAATAVWPADPAAPAVVGVPEADLALREAVRAGDADGVTRSARRGGRPDQTAKLGVSLLQQAALAGRVDVVAALLAAGATVDLRSSLGETPLHAAVGGGNLEVVHRLLSAGADPNARMKFERSPLGLAAEADRAEIARRLIAGGARVGDAAKYGVTPLHVAAGRAAVATARVLLEAGADPLARDQDGDTPYDLASRLGHAELVALLAPRTPVAARRAALDPQAPVTDLERVDFRNRDYRLDDGASVRLREGVARPESPGAPEVLSTTVLLGALGPEARAAVVLRWTQAGGGPFSTLLLYGLDAGGRPLELARLPTGEGARGGVRGARFEAGELIVIREQGEAACCPERLEETRYRWDGAALVPVGPATERPL